MGAGAEIRLSQSEAVINQISDVFVQEALNTSSIAATSAVDLSAPWGIYPCAGDDEWCVITVRDEKDWTGFVRALESPDWTGSVRFSSMEQRTQNRRELDANVAAWTRHRTSVEVMERLQSFAVPAGRMSRISELAGDPHLKDRDFIAWLEQPGYEDPLPMENRPFHSTEIDAPPLRPAPAFGQDTEWVCAQVLGMEPSEIAKLMDAGILEV
jgi:crotonobetainyl-CoA:carnitine CoA-transferase CaiB-like acyl-CoA transferase